MLPGRKQKTIFNIVHKENVDELNVSIVWFFAAILSILKDITYFRFKLYLLFITQQSNNFLWS